MRIEELKQGNYVKTPDTTEHQLLNVVNRFFNSDMHDFEKSKESIILEVQKRIKPLIINLVKRVAWEEGREIFEPMIDELVGKVIEEEMSNIKDLINSIKNNLVKYKQINYTIDIPTTVIQLPEHTKIVINQDTIILSVNGVQQNATMHYEYILNDRNIVSIVLSEELEIGDIVTLDCWIYSETEAGEATNESNRI